MEKRKNGIFSVNLSTPRRTSFVFTGIAKISFSYRTGTMSKNIGFCERTSEYHGQGIVTIYAWLSQSSKHMLTQLCSELKLRNQ
jgi:hypothetical protein